MLSRSYSPLLNENQAKDFIYFEVFFLPFDFSWVVFFTTNVFILF